MEELTSMSFTRDHWHKLEKKKKKKERGYEHEVDETKRKRMLPPHPDECKKKKKKGRRGLCFSTHSTDLLESTNKVG